MNALRTKKAQEKKQKGKVMNMFLNARKKQAAENTKSEHVTFSCKGHKVNMPSQVPKAELKFSPLKFNTSIQLLGTIPLMLIPFRIWELLKVF